MSDFEIPSKIWFNPRVDASTGYQLRIEPPKTDLDDWRMYRVLASYKWKNQTLLLCERGISVEPTFLDCPQPAAFSYDPGYPSRGIPEGWYAGISFEGHYQMIGLDVVAQIPALLERWGVTDFKLHNNDQ